jgi:aspartate/methionine/tyrosine aminotransferase
MQTKLNEILRVEHPAALTVMTDLGKRLYFPKGVPVQAGEAKKAGCPFNATIGELKGEDGKALPLPSMQETIVNLSSEESFLYQAQGGRPDLRQAWSSHISAEMPESYSLPVACMGLTHGLSICADLFVDAQTDVLLPSPRWGNYDVIFGMRPQGRIHNYTVMEEAPDVRNSGFNIKGIKEAIANIQHKGVLVLNIPSNPVGYTPTSFEVEELLQAIEASTKPMVIVLDEAYKGMEWESSSVQGSIAKSFGNLDPKQFLVVKVDGATKELFFFGGRIGFVTFLCNEKSAPVLEEKVIASIRSTVSALPSPSQAMVLRALQSKTLPHEVGEIRGLLRRRYEVLKRAMDERSVPYFPFNSAFFVLVRTPNDAEEMRQYLLTKGVGVVSVPSEQAIRVSYSTVSLDKIPKMISIIADALDAFQEKIKA